MTAAAVVPSLRTLAPLLDDVGALKRVRRAGTPESVAESLFVRAWRRAVAGDDLAAIARETTALALVAAKLGAIDGAVLGRAGLAPAERRTVLERAFDASAEPLDPATRTTLRAAIPNGVALAMSATPLADDSLPGFVAALAAQPRAGATAPGTARLVIEPPESHADHCAIVAVYATLVAPRYGTEGVDAFLFGLAHHLHNAALPDSGYAGELLLGDRLDDVVDRLTAHELATLPPALAERIRAARRTIAPGAASPEARAFHAADVIDRVLQQRHHARAAAFEIEQALDERGLVHAGPTQRFALDVLAEAGLP